MPELRTRDETSGAQRQVSQEVTLALRTTKLNWIGGVYWFDEHIVGQIEITGDEFRGQSTVDTGVWALFGQARYRLSDRVVVTGGLRYSREREEGAETRAHHVRAGVADAAWTPKGAVELEASRDTFVFVSATRGFKSGGVNVYTEESGTTFRPELAWSYEAGLKRTLPGERGRVNAVLFWVDYRDLQVQSILRPGLVDVSNAGRATSKASRWRGPCRRAGDSSSWASCRGSTLFTGST